MSSKPWKCLILAALAAGSTGPAFSLEPAHTPTEVKAVMKKVADWQIEHLRDDYGRERKSDNGLDKWTYAAMYIGMEKWASMADDDTYYEFLLAIGEELKWDLGRSRYFADDQAVGVGGVDPPGVDDHVLVVVEGLDRVA